MAHALRPLKGIEEFLDQKGINSDDLSEISIVTAPTLEKWNSLINYDLSNEPAKTKIEIPTQTDAAQILVHTHDDFHLMIDETKSEIVPVKWNYENIAGKTIRHYSINAATIIKTGNSNINSDFLAGGEEIDKFRNPQDYLEKIGGKLSDLAIEPFTLFSGLKLIIGARGRPFKSIRDMATFEIVPELEEMIRNRGYTGLIGNYEIDADVLHIRHMGNNHDILEVPRTSSVDNDDPILAGVILTGTMVGDRKKVSKVFDADRYLPPQNKFMSCYEKEDIGKRLYQVIFTYNPQELPGQILSTIRKGNLSQTQAIGELVKFAETLEGLNVDAKKGLIETDANLEQMIGAVYLTLHGLQPENQKWEKATNYFYRNPQVTAVTRYDLQKQQHI